MHTNVFNKLLDLVRASPGIAAINNGGTYELPSGRIDQSPVMYRGCYITYTDHIPVKNSGSETGYDLYALNFDSGNRTGGIGGLAKSAAMLMKLTDLMPDPTIAGYFRNLAMTSAIINYNQYSARPSTSRSVTCKYGTTAAADGRPKGSRPLAPYHKGTETWPKHRRSHPTRPRT